jgi:opacity protein-like surface antigen
MKKILLGLAASAVLFTAANANSFSDKYVNTHVGATYMEIESITGYGVTFGSSLDIPIFEDKVPGLIAGGSFNVDLLATDDETDISNGFAYGADITAHIGCNLEKKLNVPVTVRMGVGYGFTQLETDIYTYGVEYVASADYRFSDKYSVTASYTAQPGATLNIGGYDAPDIDNSKMSIFFNWKY